MTSTTGESPIRIALLGSTGSIGRQTLDVVEATGAFEVIALAAGSNEQLLNEQAARFHPKEIALGSRDGDDALERIATRDDVDLLVVGTGGVVSLRPIIAALRAGKPVATANKETLVAGGHLVMPLAKELAAMSANDPLRATPLFWLRPIDSEHSALWQCLVGERLETVRRVILTASGGPFRDWTAERIASAAPEQALAHPNWSMGAKITVDSASLANKGLEVIEARWLYDLDDEQIDVLVHPQSLVHSLVEFVDGSIKAQLGLPDMRIPIQYAVSYPRRQAGPAPRLDLLDHDRLTFEPVDEQRFPALSIAREAGRQGPRSTAALIAADEVAVRRFLDRTLPFGDIPMLLEAAVDRFGGSDAPPLDELIALETEVRAWAESATPSATGATA